jgi:Transposase
MTCFVGLDVSVKETAVCIVDDTGKLMCEQHVPTEPDDIVTLLISVGDDYGRVGIEAGPLSQWLVNGLTAAGLPVVCVETRHMMALLKGQQINKSDRNDARGIAQMMRVGLFKPVHVKTQLHSNLSPPAGPDRLRARATKWPPWTRSMSSSLLCRSLRLLSSIRCSCAEVVGAGRWAGRYHRPCRAASPCLARHHHQLPLSACLSAGPEPGGPQAASLRGAAAPDRHARR